MRVKKSMAKNKHVAEENILEIDKDGKGVFKVEQWRNFCDLYNLRMELRKNEYLAMFLAITGDKYTWKSRSKFLSMSIDELKKFVDERNEDWDKKYYDAVEMIKKARQDRMEQSEQFQDKQMKEAADKLVADTQKKQKGFQEKTALMEKVFVKGILPDTRCSHIYKGDEPPDFPPTEQETVDFLCEAIEEMENHNITVCARICSDVRANF